MFRNSFYRIGGEERDILQNGKLSCAVFVSAVLYMFRLIKEMHATVDGFVKDMERCGWKKTDDPEPGDVIVWEPAVSKDGSSHKHTGFYIGNKQAISNDSGLKCPIKHHITFGVKKGKPARRITAVYRLNFKSIR